MAIRRTLTDGSTSALEVGLATDPQPSALRSPRRLDSTDSSLLEWVREALDRGDAAGALESLEAAGPLQGELLNARAVCLLRLGRFAEAVSIYRSFLLDRQWAGLRQGLPLHLQTNFATALLLSGRPSGCLAVLAEVADPQHPKVERLRETLRQWQATLPWWPRWNWRWGRIDPVGYPVCVNFLPGDLDDSVGRGPSDQPSRDPGTAPTQAA